MADETAAVAALLGISVPSAHKNDNNVRMNERYLKRSATELSEPKEIATEVPAIKRRKRREKEPEHEYPVPPRVIHVVKIPKTHVDHSYRDFSSVPPEEGYEEPLSVEECTFSQKLHRLLSSPEYSDTISWLPHGRAFKILRPKRLEEGKVLQRFFGHNRYSAFLIQLKKYGLKNITEGKDRGAYYHECMLRGLPHLCKYMPKFRECRRLITDPKNEPDFYAISLLWPLPNGLKDPCVAAEPQTAVQHTAALQALQETGTQPENLGNLPPSLLVQLVKEKMATQTSTLKVQERQGPVASFIRQAFAKTTDAQAPGAQDLDKRLKTQLLMNQSLQAVGHRIAGNGRFSVNGSVAAASATSQAVKPRIPPPPAVPQDPMVQRNAQLILAQALGGQGHRIIGNGASTILQEPQGNSPALDLFLQQSRGAPQSQQSQLNLLASLLQNPNLTQGASSVQQPDKIAMLAAALLQGRASL